MLHNFCLNEGMKRVDDEQGQPMAVFENVTRAFYINQLSTQSQDG